MFAILGLFSLALGAVMMTGTDIMDDTTEKDHARDTPDTESSEPEIVSMESILDDAGSGFSDGSDDDLFIVTGNDDDLVTAGGGDDVIDTRDGNDTIFAGEGDDEMHGGRGDDALDAAGGDDTLYGHTGDDVLSGGDGNDGLIGGDGDDTLFGGAGDDALQGYLGNDTLVGGKGADVLFGGAGDDVLDGRDDGTMDFLNGGAGDDVIFAGVGDHVNGGTGADRIGLESNANAIVDDFDIDEDTIEIAYDINELAPIVRFEDTDAGAVLLADGAIVATFTGHTALDLASVPVVLTPTE